MDLQLLTIIVNIIVVPVIGIISFILKDLYKKVQSTVSRQEIRLLITDQLKPLQVMLEVLDKRLDLIEKEQHLIFREVKRNGEKGHRD